MNFIKIISYNWVKPVDGWPPREKRSLQAKVLNVKVVSGCLGKRWSSRVCGSVCVYVGSAFSETQLPFTSIVRAEHGSEAPR